MDVSEAFDQLVAKLESWVEGFITMLPDIVVATIVLILFWFLAKYASKGVRRALGRVMHHDSIADLLAKVARAAITIAGLFVALGILELDKTVTSLLAGVGILGLALGFAFQDIAANFVSGVLLAMRRPFETGDIVETGGEMGVITEINLRSTVMRTFSGQHVIIPNKDVFGNSIKNYTRTGCRRVEIPVGVAYDSDLREVVEVTRGCLQELADECGPGEVQIIYTGFGGSSIDLEARFWLSETNQGKFLEAKSEGMMRLKDAYDEAGIEIPFPIRTLDVDRDLLDAIRGAGLDVEPGAEAPSGDGDGQAAGMSH